MLVVPNQAPGALERYGVTRAEADRSAWVITVDGRRYEGAAALNRVLAEVPRWRGAAWLYGISPIAAVEEAFYRWFAAHRR